MKFPLWPRKEGGGLSAVGLSLLLMLGVAPRRVEASRFSSAELKRMSIEELMDIEVFSVSKQKETLEKTDPGHGRTVNVKILILIDGRTLHTPSHAGIYLEVR